jgi:hypothetical protein
MHKSKVWFSAFLKGLRAIALSGTEVAINTLGPTKIPVEPLFAKTNQTVEFDHAFRELACGS